MEQYQHQDQSSVMQTEVLKTTWTINSISMHQFDKPIICLIWTLKENNIQNNLEELSCSFMGYKGLEKYKGDHWCHEKIRKKKQLQFSYQQNKAIIILLKKSPTKVYLLVLDSTRIVWFCCWRLYISWSILKIKRILLDYKFKTSSVENISCQRNFKLVTTRSKIA